MLPRQFVYPLMFAACGVSGCFSPRTTRMPGPHYQPLAVERYRAEVVDPYPDRLSGPDTGFRPPGFQHQRSEPLRAKRRANEILSAPIFAPQGGFPQNGYAPGYPIPPTAYAPPAYYIPPTAYIPPEAMYPSAVPHY